MGDVAAASAATDRHRPHRTRTVAVETSAVVTAISAVADGAISTRTPTPAAAAAISVKETMAAEISVRTKMVAEISARTTTAAAISDVVATVSDAAEIRRKPRTSIEA